MSAPRASISSNASIEDLKKFSLDDLHTRLMEISHYPNQEKLAEIKRLCEASNVKLEEQNKDFTTKYRIEQNINTLQFIEHFDEANTLFQKAAKYKSVKHAELGDYFTTVNSAIHHYKECITLSFKTNVLSPKTIFEYKNISLKNMIDLEVVLNDFLVNSFLKTNANINLEDKIHILKRCVAACKNIIYCCERIAPSDNWIHFKKDAENLLNTHIHDLVRTEYQAKELASKQTFSIATKDTNVTSLPPQNEASVVRKNPMPKIVGKNIFSIKEETILDISNTDRPELSANAKPFVPQSQQMKKK